VNIFVEISALQLDFFFFSLLVSLQIKL